MVGSGLHRACRAFTPHRLARGKGEDGRGSSVTHGPCPVLCRHMGERFQSGCPHTVARLSICRNKQIFACTPPPPLQPTGHCGFSVPASQTSTLKGKWHLVSGVDSSVRTQRSREVPRPQPAEWRCGRGGRAPTETFSALVCVHRRLRRWPRRCHQVSMQGTEQGAKWRG